MLSVVDVRFVEMKLELSVLRRHLDRFQTADELLRPAPESDQVLDRDDLQRKPIGHFLELRQSGHRTVFVQDLAEHARRSKPGQPRQIDRRLSMPRSSKHASRTGSEGKHVAGPPEIGRLRPWIDESADRFRTVTGRNPRRRSFDCIDTDGERRSVERRVLVHHHIQLKVPQTFFRCRQTD